MGDRDTNPTDLPTLASVNLGDVVSLPDGTEMTVRARVLLPTPVGQMAGFVACGELEALISFPLVSASPYVIYRRVGQRPPEGIRARAAYSGVANYWAPHLPAARGAMGEVLWRVADLVGSLDPLVVLWRSGEPAVFMRDGEAHPDDLGVKWMPRDRPDDRDFTRQTSEVHSPAWTPADVGAPSRERAPAGR